MTTEGTYVYACPMPDHNDLQGGPIPTTGVITISTPSMLTDQDQIQSLIDTIAKQQNEIEAYKSAILLMKGYMTEKQLLSLSYMAQLLTEGK